MPTARRHFAAFAFVFGAASVHAGDVAAGAPDPEQLSRVVGDTERAFAQSMADRDLAAFTRFLSADTVFQGASGALRGPAAVVAAWRKFFDGAHAPFSWEPDKVVVMTNGELAMTSGPVRDSQGKLIARFNSVWRQEAPGVWRIVLDMGSDACECARP
jgi:ketosteroid isomerase-like protein